MNTRSVAIFAVVVAILVGVAIWFLNSDIAPHAAPTAAAATPTPKPLAPASNPTTTTKTTQTSPIAPQDPPQVDTAPVPQPAAMTEDDRKIDEVLRLYPGNTDADHTNTAQSLINLLPTLTKDGQVECAQHVANLLSDDEFKRVMPIWRNPSFNPDVIEVFATDLMNREHKVMLPAMLDAVRMPNHPYNEEAKTTLQVFLDEDYGNDVGKWEKAMKDFLKKEAEEESGVESK
jgi:hypothetical protein